MSPVSKDVSFHYSKGVRVPYPECDIHNHWKLSHIMRAVQQIASDQLDDLGMTFRKLYSEGYVFLLSKEYLQFHQGITAGEMVRISTWPIPPKGAQFRRNVAIDSMDGQRLMSGYTTWLLVDPQNHKILRPAAFPYELRYAPLNENDPIEEELSSMKPAVAGNNRPGQSLKVAYSNSDCNGHLNNAVYGDLVMDCLPFEIWEEYCPESFLIHFIREAKVGAEVQTMTGHDGDLWSFDGAVLPAEPQRAQGGQGRQGEQKWEKCFQASLRLARM